MTTGPFDVSRFLGYVSKVSPKGIQVHFPSADLLSRFRHGGIQYPGGNVGEFIIVEGEKFGFVARILSLELPDNERKVLSEKAVHEENTSFHPIADAELLFSFLLTNPEVFERTISRFPEIGAKVYSCQTSFLENILSLSIGTENDFLFAKLGKLASNGMACPIPLDSMFGRHCAVVGTTGSGKSWTVSRLIEAVVSKTRNKIIILDPTGEYSSLDSDCKVKSFTIGVNCHFPYEELHISDLFYLLRPTAQSQRPILMEAIRSLKTVRLAKSCSPNSLDRYIKNGVLVKSGNPKQSILGFQYQNIGQIDDAYCAFDILKLGFQICEECVFLSGASDDVWGNRDQKTFDYQSSLKLRVKELLSSKDFDSIFGFTKETVRQSHSLVDVFKEFLVNTESHVLRLDFSNTTSMFNSREILANSLARHFYDLAKKGTYKNNPILVFVDEAHLFLNRKLLDADQSVIPLDAFDLIAKECRKFGLFLCLATQMPRDIPVGTLSQMGTFVVHRLINEQDRKVVETACSSASHSSLAYLPVLGPGEALLTGVDFPMPLLIKIDEPSIPPASETPKLLPRTTSSENTDVQPEMCIPDNPERRSAERGVISNV